MRALLLGVCVTVTLGVTACDDLTETTEAGDASTTVTSLAEASTTVSEAPTTTTTVAATTTTLGSLLSQESLDYAASIGGTDHYGETLWFAIGQGALSSEAQAKTLLEPAKALGDMQSNFIVQNSSNFDGMTPGYWIIFEAYYEKPGEGDLVFLRVPFPDIYVKSAVVMTHDPIPVRHATPSP